MQRVNKINDEVFEQVMEAEMALAGLETEDLDKIYIPEHMRKKNSKTLLKRMSTLKMNLQAKKSGGKVVGLDQPHEESSATSISEESEQFSSSQQ